MLKENTVDTKQEVQEYEERGPFASGVPELLLSKDWSSDPGGLDADFIEDTDAERELSGLKREEDFYTGGNFYCNCCFRSIIDQLFQGLTVLKPIMESGDW